MTKHNDKKVIRQARAKKLKPPAQPVKCLHQYASWKPVEIEYRADGTADVSQYGACRSCKQGLVLVYEGETQETEY